MRSIFYTLLIASSAVLATNPVAAQTAKARKTGSVLIFMGHRSGPNNITLLSVTNTKGEPQTPTSFGGSVDAHFEYVNVTMNPLDPFCPTNCTIFNRHEFLTPNDTITVLTRCHNAPGPNAGQGYVVVTAQDPEQSNVDICFDHLMGSQFVFNASGMFLILNAQPIQCAAGPEGTPTDLNGNNMQDFDGNEYVPLSDKIMIESFIAGPRTRLCIVNLTGECTDTNTLYFSVYNDNEFPLSATRPFKIWFDQPLEDVAPLFRYTFLASLPNDPTELDIFCNNDDDLETGWAIIESIGVRRADGISVTDDGVVVGCIAVGIGGDPLLWESDEPQYNGLFLGRPSVGPTGP
ncbi:MAG: hypothetical protein KDB80_03415 [Planctomycetes bacterium]|nr:hypothetical protein [Planctomycetota bacterium]